MGVSQADYDIAEGYAAGRKATIEECAKVAEKLESEAFERGRLAGKNEAAMETKYGSFRAHVQAVIREARKVRDALEGDKLADGLGAALNAHDDFLAAGQPLP